MDLCLALDRLASAVLAAGGPPFAPFVPVAGAAIAGDFEVRSADGHVRRMQNATLQLPASLARAFAHGAPTVNARVPMGAHALTLWAPSELIELQVGHRWHGFTGKRMREWDERLVVFAEDGGDPVALRLDEDDGPVWIAPRGEGRHAFRWAAPDLASFFLCLAEWLEVREALALEERLVARFGASASALWIWRELVTGESACR